MSKPTPPRGYGPPELMLLLRSFMLKLVILSMTMLAFAVVPRLRDSFAVPPEIALK